MPRKEFLIVVIVMAIVFTFAYLEPSPVRKLMDWRAARNTQSESEIRWSEYQVYDYTNGEDADITVDFLKGKHFWNPQLAIWLEDSTGKFIETLLVTSSTAKGLFYGGRTASNFKEADGIKSAEGKPTQRVDALPYWSHKRDHKYDDGLYSPPPAEPLPDAITGATPKENFYFKATAEKVKDLTAFRVMVEVNVAFDENEFYSEYDFLEDSLYHGGTGLLGQPSLVYGTTINRQDAERYYILSLFGHGHHSGATGDLTTETKTITTAKYVVERIVVGIKEEWYNREL
jgi:hypothetical protein